MQEVQLFGYFLLFCCILYLAYIASRVVGKKAASTMQSRHMQVVEQISLGLDKRLLLVRVGSEYFLFLSGRKEFRQVAKVKLDREEAQNQDEGKTTGTASFDFHQIFDKIVHNRNSKKDQSVHHENEQFGTHQSEEKSGVLKQKTKDDVEHKKSEGLGLKKSPALEQRKNEALESENSEDSKQSSSNQEHRNTVEMKQRKSEDLKQRKNEVLQQNIRKLEQLRLKSDDKEV